MTAPPNPPTYGWRAKLGVIVPPTNTVNEAEWNLAVPDGVTVHAARMTLHTDTTSVEGLNALHRDLAEAVHSLKPAGVAAIAYGCTAGSMITPRHALAEKMSGEVDLPCVTTAAAIVDALEVVRAKKIAVATPYDKRLNDHEVEFLTSQGLEVLAIEGLGLGANGPAEYPLIHRVPKSRILELARSVDRSGADALVISCTDFPTFGLIEELESELGKPVITSNQATLWATLHAAGIGDKLPELGQLFRDF
ncbi:MAG: hypothetical protein HN725_10835 [Alphaproteobacteria bacterium]|jgi:maleate cis-trans isomerase|nr:hypothetical protein [Alphaproteobacteria bacterium]MBT4082214.1 hypothetical protein [Alphaproteobacteria bacterium]MBT4544995.1 hypothetical protein [Alphaproteobacteria bacterium]MBT7745778.1 hypothetical protein [Alphaproteobacteria bacterium]